MSTSSTSAAPAPSLTPSQDIENVTGAQCRSAFEVAAATHQITVERFGHRPREYKYSHSNAMYALWSDAWRAALAQAVASLEASTAVAAAAPAQAPSVPVSAGWFVEAKHHDGSVTTISAREGISGAFELFRMSPEVIPAGWRSMRTAPRDGTMILICETPNGEHYNVMPAAYQLHLGEPLMEGFWGVWPTSHLPSHLIQERHAAVSERGLPADFKALAITPLCWQPFPECEPIEKLRRRASQVYAANSRARAQTASLKTQEAQSEPAAQTEQTVHTSPVAAA